VGRERRRERKGKAEEKWEPGKGKEMKGNGWG